MEDIELSLSECGLDDHRGRLLYRPTCSQARNHLDKGHSQGADKLAEPHTMFLVCTSLPPPKTNPGCALDFDRP